MTEGWRLADTVSDAHESLTVVSCRIKVPHEIRDANCPANIPGSPTILRSLLPASLCMDSTKSVACFAGGYHRKSSDPPLGYKTDSPFSWRGSAGATTQERVDGRGHSAHYRGLTPPRQRQSNQAEVWCL